MVDENQLEDTSDSIQPIQNGLGIPTEIFTEFIREFDRACQVKYISRTDLENHLHSPIWRVRCIAVGAVSNVLIASVTDPSELLNLLNSSGEEVVVTEIIRTIINKEKYTFNSPKEVSTKKSTGKIATTATTPKSGSLAPKKDSKALNNRIVYQEKKGNSNVLLLSVLAIFGIVIIVAGFLLMRPRPQSVAEPTVTRNHHSAEPKSEPPHPVAQPPVAQKQPEKQTATAAMETSPVKQVEEAQKSAFTGKMIVPQGIFIYQVGEDHFLGGDMINLFSNRRKSTNSPFTIGSNKGIAYVLIKFDLQNIPSSAIIENAQLRLNLTIIDDDASSIKIYCLPLQKNWSSKTVLYNKEDLSSGIAYDGLMNQTAKAKEATQNLRNDWVIFDVSDIVRDWVTHKQENYGFALFSNTEANAIFEGFDSFKRMMTPALKISFSDGKKEASAVDKKEEPVIQSKENKGVTAVDKPSGAEASSRPKALQEEKNKEEKLTSDDTGNVLDTLDGHEKESTDKATVRNVFEDDPELATDKEKTKEAPDKTNPKSQKESPPKKVTKNTTKVTENKPTKTEGAPSNVVADVTMKETVVFPNTRLLDIKDEIKITNPEGNGEIRYTTDGQEPTPDSLLYASPFKLSGTQLHVVKSAVFVDRVRKSPVCIQEFRILNNQQGQLIDNNMAACRKTGNWESSQSKKDYYGKDYAWLQQGDGTVVWTPSITRSTKCEVYLWLPDGDFVRPKQAKYVVTFDGGTKEVIVDQSKRDTHWIYLGVYPMKGGAGSLTLVKDGGTSNRMMYIADAAYFYFTND